MKQSKIIWSIIGATFLFIAIGFAVNDFSNKSSSKTFETYLQDASRAEVHIQTSTPYNETEWFKIKRIVYEACSKTHDTYELNDQLPKILDLEGYDIIGFNLTRRIIIVE